MIEYYGYRYIPADTSQYDKTFKYWHLGTVSLLLRSTICLMGNQ